MSIERLEIPLAKIEGYLLNLEHPEGWSKAKFFLARGFSREHPDTLANALAQQAMRDWPGDELLGVDAMKHRITGPLSCPDGSTPDVLSVWQVKKGSGTASFVTARPSRPRAGLETP